MKKIIILLLSLFSINVLFAAPLKSEVNECFELTSIVFYLADAREYMNNHIPGYAKDIDEYFTKYKNHRIISYVKKLRETTGISYNAVPAAAGQIMVKNGGISIKHGVDVSQADKIEKRWTEEDFTEFVRLLDDFYRETDFGSFYTQHLDLYKIAETRMDSILTGLNIDWFNTFFRDPIGSPLVVIAMCNGPHNYKFATLSDQENYSFGIAIGVGSDQDGLPFFTEGATWIIAHELLHYYTNPFVEKYWSELEPVAEEMYKDVKEKMAAMAYSNSLTTMVEGFNHLFTVMYLRDNPLSFLTIEDFIITEQSSGFIWLETAVQFMDNFDREKYATIDDFMPQLVEFLKDTAENIDDLILELTSKMPYITSVSPENNSTVAIDRILDNITIHFSLPMATGFMFNNVEGAVQIPIRSKLVWQDEYTLIIPVNSSELDSNITYGIKAIRGGFRSKVGYGLMDDFIYTFKTE